MNNRSTVEIMVQNSASLRSIVKHSYIKSSPSAPARARAHLKYLQFRPGKDRDDAEHRSFFDNKKEGISYRTVVEKLDQQRRTPTLIHKLIISPGVDGADIKAYTRQVMDSLCRATGQPLVWHGVAHYNTANPHAHVVIMGVDARGDKVFLSKFHYLQMRQAGDRYLDDSGLLARHKQLDKERKVFGPRVKSWLDSIVTAVRDRINAVMGGSEPTSTTTYKFNRTTLQHGADTAQPNQARDEERCLGDAPDAHKLLLAQLQVSDWDQRIIASRKKSNSKPIVLAYSADQTEEKIVYTQNSSLTALRELETLYQSGDELATKSMSPDDFHRLQRWIKDSWREKKKLDARASSIKAIELGFTDESTNTFSQSSAVDDLIDLHHRHLLGTVFLQDDELHALNNWLLSKGGQEALEKASCPPASSALAYFDEAYGRAEAWALNLMPAKKYEELVRIIRDEPESEKAYRESKYQRQRSNFKSRKSIRDR